MLYSHKAPKIVIVGRTNVGKSTIFNRLIEEQKSLVSAIPGTTRDRFEADCIWRAQVVRLVDTGGLDVDRSDEIESNIELQAKIAIEEADLLLFVVDAQAGLQPEDRELAKLFHKAKTPLIVVANKADNAKMRESVNEPEWHKWSLGAPMPLSAKRGIGAGDLLDEMYKILEETGNPPVDIAEVTSTRVAVIGRPNVGKSTLLNSMLGEHRFITADENHTTREPNDTMINVDSKDYTLIDTAGIRKLAKVRASQGKLEQSGVERSLMAVKKADVVLFVLDVTEKIKMQDKFLGGELAKAGASVVIVANKWDLIPDKETNTINEYLNYIKVLMPMLTHCPIVFTDAVTGKRVPGLFDAVDKVFKARFTQLDGDETRKFISQAIVRHKPSRSRGVAHPKIKFFVQTGINPPTFKLGIKQSRKDALNESYLRFLKNRLRERYDFEGTPLRIHVVAKKKTHTT